MDCWVVWACFSYFLRSWSILWGDTSLRVGFQASFWLVSICLWKNPPRWLCVLPYLITAIVMLVLGLKATVKCSVICLPYLWLSFRSFPDFGVACSSFQVLGKGAGSGRWWYKIHRGVFLYISAHRICSEFAIFCYLIWKHLSWDTGHSTLKSNVLLLKSTFQVSWNRVTGIFIVSEWWIFLLNAFPKFHSWSFSFPRLSQVDQLSVNRFV